MNRNNNLGEINDIKDEKTVYISGIFDNFNFYGKCCIDNHLNIGKR